MANERITIIGAGLVGSLLALLLAQRGHSVLVLERRPDMRIEKISAGRSINLAISARGLRALAAVGLEEEVLGNVIPMRGRMVHDRKGAQSFQRYGKDDSQRINSISRARLNMILLTHAGKTGNVEFRFRHRVQGLTAEGHLQVLDESTGESLVIESARVFGADGASSALREHLRATGAIDEHVDRLQHGYKELEIPAGDRGQYQLDPHSLHIWPRGNHMLIALPNRDGSFTCTLFLGFGGEGQPAPTGAQSFASLTDEAAVLAWFEQEFPDAKAMMPNLTRDFFENPTGHMVTVKAAPWRSARALLIGDAAHAIVPFFGQGMNCGFEDCSVLGELLTQAAEASGSLQLTAAEWDAVFERFELARKPNADAIADMAVENFVEMRDKTADPTFVLHKAIEQRLFQAFPDKFLSRYTLVSFSLAPYAFAAKVGEVAQGIVSELAEGLSSAESIDLERAERLIAERLSPLLAGEPSLA